MRRPKIKNSKLLATLVLLFQTVNTGITPLIAHAEERDYPEEVTIEYDANNIYNVLGVYNNGKVFNTHTAPTYANYGENALLNERRYKVMKSELSSINEERGYNGSIVITTPNVPVEWQSTILLTTKGTHKGSRVKNVALTFDTMELVQWLRKTADELEITHNNQLNGMQQ